MSREELELVLGLSARSQSHPRRSSQSHAEHQAEVGAGEESEDGAEADETDSLDAPRQASREPALPPHLVAPYIRLLERYEYEYSVHGYMVKYEYTRASIWHSAYILLTMSFVEFLLKLISNLLL